MKEINLLKNYPITKRNLDEALVERTDEVREIARKFDKDFFDGDRNYGYGGFKYDGRWKDIAKKVIDRYKLDNTSKILQINCEMGFFLHDIKKILPNLEVYGIETSSYAYQNFYDEDIKSNVSLVDNYCKLNYENYYFDFILCIGAVYTLNLTDIIKILKEIVRVGKNKSFINLASYETHNDYWLMKEWSLLGTTILKKDDWKKILKYVNYKSDFSFTNANSLNIKRSK